MNQLMDVIPDAHVHGYSTSLSMSGQYVRQTLTPASDSVSLGFMALTDNPARIADRLNPYPSR
jgi:hypothetical protein